MAREIIKGKKEEFRKDLQFQLYISIICIKNYFIYIMLKMKYLIFPEKSMHSVNYGLILMHK